MVKLIGKGILLWITTVCCTFFIMGVESLVEQENWWTIILWLTTNILLIKLATKYISSRDLYILSGSKWLDKHL